MLGGGRGARGRRVSGPLHTQAPARKAAAPPCRPRLSLRRRDEEAPRYHKQGQMVVQLSMTPEFALGGGGGSSSGG